MGCKECGKPKCNGECGCKSPKVLQINNPAEYITFHKVSIPAAMGDSTTNPPKIGAYRNALVYYEADHTSWMYSTDGIPTKLTNGLTDYNEAVNLPQINGHTLIGNQSSSDLGLQGELTAGANIQINGNTISATDTTYTAGNGIELDDTEIKAKIGDGLEFDNDGEINIAGIEQYAHFFDTVADMQASTNLIDGSYARTLGYLRMGDGVYNLYTIREIVNTDVVDGYNIVSILSTDNLVAERLQYGDDLVIEIAPTDNIQDYLDLVGKKTIKLPADTTITVQDVLLVNSDTEIDLNGSTIFFDYARPATFPAVNWDETLGFMGFGPNDSFTGYNGYKNITIRNGVIKGGCSCFMHNENILFEDVEFTTIMSRHAMQFASCYGVAIRRCTFNGTKHGEGVEHSAECINIDPCTYGGQPWVSQDSAMYDHSPNKFIAIENNTFKTSTVDGQLYGCAVGSHGLDETGALICENFIAVNNSFGSPYADAINVSDYDQVTISNNTVEFSTLTHDQYTFFVHGRGGLKNMTITDNIVENVGQFIYSDSSTRDRKNLLIEGNTVTAIDLPGYAVMQLFHYENVNIQHNTIKCQYRAVHIGSLGSDPVLYSVNANFKYNEVTTSLGGDVFLRFSNVHGCQVIGNTINYIGVNNMAWEWTLALQDDTTDAIVMHNKTSDPRHFVNVTSMTDKFMYNNAIYQLSSSSGTSISGTLAKPLVNFTKLVLPLGDLSNTQFIELQPWTPTNRNKFFWGNDTSRTYKFPVTKNDNTVGIGVLTINNDNTFSYSGDISLRSIYARD